MLGWKLEMARRPNTVRVRRAVLRCAKQFYMLTQSWGFRIFQAGYMLHSVQRGQSKTNNKHFLPSDKDEVICTYTELVSPGQAPDLREAHWILPEMFYLSRMEKPLSVTFQCCRQWCYFLPREDISLSQQERLESTSNVQWRQEKGMKPWPRTAPSVQLFPRPIYTPASPQFGYLPFQYAFIQQIPDAFSHTASNWFLPLTKKES